MLIRSQATGWNTVPAVSMVMCSPSVAQPLGERHDLRRDHRLAAGHHHVARRVRPHLVQNLVELSSAPSGCQDVYGVSHQAQRRLQPLVRMKTDGTPTSEPSPCSE